ncbi:hypothetical protein Tco_0247054 [Tanacetum coccineum]
MPITSAKDKAQRRLEVNARSTLMMGIPNEHQLKFNSIKDAKLLLEAKYENFTAPSSEMLDQTFDRLQSLVKSVGAFDEKDFTEDVNQKTMSMDDLYNNLKVYEPEVKGMSSSSSRTKNMAFVSSSNNNTSNSNEAVYATHGVTTITPRVLRRSVSIRCQGYIGDFVLGCHAKDMVALYSVMSDSDESGVTYTEVSSPFEGLSDIGSPRADDHEYLELPWMPEDPYMEAALQAPPSPDYVPGPEELEQAPLSHIMFQAQSMLMMRLLLRFSHMLRMPHPLLSHLTMSRRDDGDDEDEPSEEDEDDDVDMEADEDKEEEEHPTPADSVVVALPAVDHAPSAEET